MGSNKYLLSNDELLESAKPADFSFKKFNKLKAVSVESARKSRIGKVPAISSESDRFLTRALWLNNNRLPNFVNLDMFIESVIDDPFQLRWLDLSYNHITTIDESITHYPKLRIVYLHGNRIHDLNEIVKMKQLKELKSVCFHGNPISEKPQYRLSVINILPQISVLDFAPVLRSERLHPSPLHIYRLPSMRLLSENKLERKGSTIK